ncbi:MAG: hypothetical protein KBC44_03200, partial [Candidatus Pacebacteria bacterium]|nr:hypothetical protein [Candidatus Paceibacterota bacterium]
MTTSKKSVSKIKIITSTIFAFLFIFSMSLDTAYSAWISDPRPIPYGVIPKKPTGLTATPGGCGTGIINVSWNASVGAISYSLRDGATTIYTG